MWLGLEMENRRRACGAVEGILGRLELKKRRGSGGHTKELTLSFSLSELGFGGVFVISLCSDWFMEHTFYPHSLHLLWDPTLALKNHFLFFFDKII